MTDSDIAWLCSLKEDGHCGEGTLELSMRTARNDRIDRILSALAGPSPPDPQQVKEAVSREDLIEIVMRETTDEITEDGLVIGRPNVLVQGCTFIRGPASSRGYERPEEAARAFAGLIVDALLSTSSARVRELEGEPTDEMAKAGMPWLEHYHHMRAGDKRNAVKNAFRAMITVARSALHPEGKPDHD